MTTGQAYHILGVRPGASRTDIERAYAAALGRLQRQLVPGTPLAERQKAPKKMAELDCAYQLLKSVAAPTVQPTGPVSMPSGPTPAGPPHLWVLPAGFAVAAVVLVAVVFGMRPSPAPQEPKTARLRVLSVPWSYVTVDGQSLGPSGQVEAFILKPGDRTVVLRHGDRVLSQTVHLAEDSETIIKAQLEKGYIDVAQK
jgi:hypothetical protein